MSLSTLSFDARCAAKSLIRSLFEDALDSMTDSEIVALLQKGLAGELVPEISPQFRERVAIIHEAALHALGGVPNSPESDAYLQTASAVWRSYRAEYDGNPKFISFLRTLRAHYPGGLRVAKDIGDRIRDTHPTFLTNPAHCS